MTVTALTPEERVRRVKAALAEAGHPDAVVMPSVEPPGVLIGSYEPLEVQWRAAALAGAVTRCWPCYRAHPIYSQSRPPCDHDPLTSPWPEVVR